jgi:putative FmdB family regulatory protein
MPTYEYECLACKKRFERFQKFTDPPVSECPECGGSLRKVLFPAGVVFKGSGWYINDSRKSTGSDGSSDSSIKSETKSDTKSDAKSDAKSDTKTETKTESKAGSKSESASGPTGRSTKSETSSPAKA